MSVCVRERERKERVGVCERKKVGVRARARDRERLIMGLLSTMNLIEIYVGNR